jgi:predicted transcriptional regulator
MNAQKKKRAFSPNSCDVISISSDCDGVENVLTEKDLLDRTPPKCGLNLTNLAMKRKIDVQDNDVFNKQGAKTENNKALEKVDSQANKNKKSKVMLSDHENKDANISAIDAQPAAKYKTKKQKVETSFDTALDAKLNTPKNGSLSMTPKKESTDIKETPKMDTSNEPAIASKKQMTQSFAPVVAAAASDTPAIADASVHSKQSATAAPLVKKKRMTFEDKLVQFMLNALKPFSLSTLAEGMKTTEQVINFSLLTLLDKGVVSKKDFTSKSGRIKTLYWANHGVKAKELSSTMRELVPPELIQAALAENMNLRAHLDSVHAAFASISQAPSGEQLTQLVEQRKQDLQVLRQTVADTSSRIQQSSTNRSKQQSHCPRRCKLRINHMRNEWKTRKEKCNDFVDQLADGMEKKPNNIVKLLELETDESVGVTLPKLHVMDAIKK